jgi:hypothetical protein
MAYVMVHLFVHVSAGEGLKQRCRILQRPCDFPIASIDLQDTPKGKKVAECGGWCSEVGSGAKAAAQSNTYCSERYVLTAAF